jgi:peroxiredoxin
VQLTRLAEDYEKIKQAGAELLAISADEVPYAWSMGQTTGANYQILSDKDRKAIKAYGILNTGTNIEGGIAHPSVFILDREGRIRYLHVGKDPGDRPADDVLLAEIKKVSGAK